MSVDRRLSPGELKQVMEAERAGAPFLVWRCVSDGQVRVTALRGHDAFTVGRRESNDLALSGDPEASRAHARLERMGDDWVVMDDGISRNGTYVNGSRIRGRQRLMDGDRMRFGATVVSFHRPGQGASKVTAVSVAAQKTDQLTATQRRILVALCRPLVDGRAYSTPASNPEIAIEVYLGVDAVKAHMRALYRLFEIDLPQNQKRARLAEVAIGSGLVSSVEVEPERHAPTSKGYESNTMGG